MASRTSKLQDPFDILSSIWVLSCHDENPLLIYQSTVDRLNLKEDFDIKELVASRRELFRPGAPEHLLTRWRVYMLSIIDNEEELPPWLARMSRARREGAINKVGKKDGFRNQFRVGRASEKKALDLTHIDWGLQHIERMRKSAADAKEQIIKKISLGFIPVISAGIAVLSVFATIYAQFETTRIQTELKRYEVAFKPKQEGYSSFMSSLVSAFDAANARDKLRLIASLDRMEIAYYSLESFFDAMTRDLLWKRYQAFAAFCHALADGSSLPAWQDDERGAQNADGASDPDKQFLRYKTYFRTFLFSALFGR